MAGTHRTLLVTMARPARACCSRRSSQVVRQPLPPIRCAQQTSLTAQVRRSNLSTPQRFSRQPCFRQRQSSRVTCCRLVILGLLQAARPRHLTCLSPRTGAGRTWAPSITPAAGSPRLSPRIRTVSVARPLWRYALRRLKSERYPYAEGRLE
jgi:hypothetical protein